MNFKTITRPVWGWALYDFANSAYTTSIQAVIFSVYFAKQLVPQGGVPILGSVVDGTSLWGYLNSLVMAGVIVLSPPLGAVADRKSLKKQFLVLGALLGCVGAMALFWAKPGFLVYGFLVVFLATMGYELSLTFYNAFLNDVCRPDEAGYVSGLGFAFGYIGGGLCLALNMVMMMKPDLFGLGGSDSSLPVRVGFFIVGVWYFIFSLPIFFWVKDKPRASTQLTQTSVWTDVRGSIKQLMESTKDVFRQRDLGLFILSYLIYNDGIQTILLMAAIFGAQALGMSTAQLGLCYLMIQFVAFIGAMVCGRLADSWSHKKVILLTLIVYMGVTLWAVVMKSSNEFWILGVVVGLVLGGSQAASRSLFSIMIPAERSAEFFGFFSVVGKASSLIGPFVFGVVNQFYGLRVGVGSLFFFFLIGGVILLGVREKIR